MSAEDPFAVDLIEQEVDTFALDLQEEDISVVNEQEEFRRTHLNNVTSATWEHENCAQVSTPR